MSKTLEDRAIDVETNHQQTYGQIKDIYDRIQDPEIIARLKALGLDKSSLEFDKELNEYTLAELKSLLTTPVKENAKDALNGAAYAYENPDIKRDISQNPKIKPSLKAILVRNLIDMLDASANIRFDEKLTKSARSIYEENSYYQQKSIEKIEGIFDSNMTLNEYLEANPLKFETVEETMNWARDIKSFFGTISANTQETLDQ